MFENGTWAKIIDNTSSQIIAAGKIINRKDCNYDKEYNCISFDNRWFFNLNNNEKFRAEENPEQIVVEFDSEHTSYRLCYWNEKDYVNTSVDVFRDYDITELDPEVKDLVYVLNELTGIETVNSCCGHGDFPLSVTIQFSALQSIGLLAKIIYNKFCLIAVPIPETTGNIGTLAA